MNSTFTSICAFNISVIQRIVTSLYLAPFVAWESVTASDFDIKCFVPIFSALEGCLSLSCLGHRYSWREFKMRMKQIHTEEANPKTLQFEKCEA